MALKTYLLIAVAVFGLVASKGIDVKHGFLFASLANKTLHCFVLG
jgi:hypothetical protein